jgi:hypothetical protein
MIPAASHPSLVFACNHHASDVLFHVHAGRPSPSSLTTWISYARCSKSSAADSRPKTVLSTDNSSRATLVSSSRRTLRLSSSNSKRTLLPSSRRFLLSSSSSLDTLADRCTIPSSSNSSRTPGSSHTGTTGMGTGTGNNTHTARVNKAIPRLPLLTNPRIPRVRPTRSHTSVPFRPVFPSSPDALQDQDQVNAHNPEYTALRARANEAGDAMARAFDQSHAAYGSGDGAAAHQLSEQGKAHKREMEQLNEQAARWIFTGWPCPWTARCIG